MDVFNLDGDGPSQISGLRLADTVTSIPAMYYEVVLTCYGTKANVSYPSFWSIHVFMYVVTDVSVSPGVPLQLIRQVAADALFTLPLRLAEESVGCKGLTHNVIFISMVLDAQINSEAEPTTSEDSQLVRSLQDLTIVEGGNSDPITFYTVTENEEVYFGQSTKNKRDITIPEFNAALERVPDNDIYPEVPLDTQLTIAPEGLDDTTAFIKRPGLNNYEIMIGTELVAKALLDETLATEQISKIPHPGIITYYGCRVRRGRITAILIERLEHTLMEYAFKPEFSQVDKAAFFESLKSAVEYLHSLGLAHNDINPYNIMVKDGAPVLIDFDACQPVGKRLQSHGTKGWYKEFFNTSQQEHDTFALDLIQKWLQNPKRRGE
ncbi:hypothetical protein G7046_g2971 [Stylonectria norvegica]|nr:hypothetical protein G7046_g2971 [Stylonectria norvegica]